MRRLTALLIVIALPTVAAPQGGVRGAIVGTVVSDDGRPVSGARIVATRVDDRSVTEGSTDATGTFRLGEVAIGLYALTVRQLGFRPAELANVRVATGDTVRVRVTLTSAPRQLSTVVVVRSPTELDALSPESPRRIDRESALPLPTARDASSLIALVPGAKDGNLWGGAGAVTNDFKVDGVSMNHPGVGGDVLRLSRDWVDAVEIRGLGAGAEFGNFQGGMVNAITRTGTNARSVAARTYFEAARLTATNLELDEQGSELVGRAEVSGEAAGAIRPDRLFYFIGGQAVDRAFRSPDLASPAARDFLDARETRRDLRGFGKLTWLRAAGERADLILGASSARVEHAGLNGLDEVAALQSARASTLWYEVSWRRALSSRASLEWRLAGYDAQESQRGTSGAGVPGVRALRLGDVPRYQNAEFDVSNAPASHSLIVVGRQSRRMLGADHQFAGGLELSLGSWRDRRTRNGGLTWRPYVNDTTRFSGTDASTWTTVGSDWGGELRLSSRTENAATFLQDEVTIAGRVTLSPGVRVSRWSGSLTPCADSPSGERCGTRFAAVSAVGVDPRVGVAWDVTGRNTLALKAHWGRYHQGMYSLFFDRAAGADAYTNRRFYYSAPPITRSRTTFTEAERDRSSPPMAFSPFWDETILDESGVVRGYRQPYVDQTVLSVEKALGPHWKVELVGIARRNGDIVGLVDRSLATNYTALRDIKVDHRLAFGVVLDANGRPLVLDRLYVSNRDLIDAISVMNANLLPGQAPRTFAGYGPADIVALTFDPRLELSPIDAAHRSYRQLTTTVTAYFPRWRAEGSLTAAQLVGNVAGVTGHGVVGSEFTAGPFVRPNEALNSDGPLPDATEFEAKLWLTARLPFGLQGGILFTHILGERITPSFIIEGRYTFTDSAFTRAPTELIRHVIGQQVFVEPRGSRHYSSRSVLDLHLERALPLRSSSHVVLSADLFNALGSRALVRVKTDIDDQAASESRSQLGAPRQRLAPRSLRLGIRIE